MDSRAFVSIHAPPNRKERRHQHRVPSSRRSVSIHAPPNRKERRVERTNLLKALWFQSTPLPTGRSDSGARSLQLTERFQSTPLPTGRSDGANFPQRFFDVGFNPRPSQPEGATRNRSVGGPAFVQFQSTPLPTGRSDLAVDSTSVAAPVSIHAPPNRKERRY